MENMTGVIDWTDKEYNCIHYYLKIMKQIFGEVTLNDHIEQASRKVLPGKQWQLLIKEFPPPSIPQ